MNYYLIFLKLCNELLSVLSGGGNVDPPDFFIGSDDPVTGNALGVFDNAVDSYLFALGNGCSPVDVLGKCIQIRLLLQGDRDGLTAAGRIREDGIYILQSVFTQFKGESDDCVFFKRLYLSTSICFVPFCAYW